MAYMHMKDIWKDASHHMSSGHCKLKWQWHTTTYLHTKFWQGCRSTEFLIHASRNSKRYGHFGRWLGSFSQNKTYTYHMIQQLCSLVFIQRSLKHMSTQNLDIDVYSSFICNCNNLEATKISFSRWMNTSTVVHLDNGILFNTENKLAWSHEKTWTNLRYMLLGKKIQSEKTFQL